MSCIDPCLEITTCNSINFIKGLFDYRNFDISLYDYVIAQEPCDATEHVVMACVNQHVHFMMCLCGIPHRLISGKLLNNVYEWYEYLVNIAPPRSSASLSFIRSFFIYSYSYFVPNK